MIEKLSLREDLAVPSLRRRANDWNSSFGIFGGYYLTLNDSIDIKSSCLDTAPRHQHGQDSIPQSTPLFLVCWFSHLYRDSVWFQTKQAERRIAIIFIYNDQQLF